MSAPIELRRGKRKRAQVSYIAPSEEESDLDLQDLDNDTNDEEDSQYPQTQKHKSSKPKRLKRSRKRAEPCFPFLELPAEIRCRIYEYCLTDSKNGVCLESATKGYRRTVVYGPANSKIKLYRARQQNLTLSLDQKMKPSAYQDLRPAILALNHQIHNEALPYLYSSQTLHIWDTATLHAFLINLGAAQRHRLRDLVIHDWGTRRGAHKTMNHPALTLLADCTGLERVYFNTRVTPVNHAGGADSGKFAARQLFRDGFVWLESMGFEKSLEVVRLDERANFTKGHYYRCPNHLTPPRSDDPMMMKEARDAFEAELGKLMGHHRRRRRD